MLRFFLIWIFLAFVLGIAFGKFAREGMGTRCDEHTEEKRENEKRNISENDADGTR